MLTIGGHVTTHGQLETPRANALFQSAEGDYRRFGSLWQTHACRAPMALSKRLPRTKELATASVAASLR